MGAEFTQNRWLPRSRVGAAPWTLLRPYHPPVQRQNRDAEHLGMRSHAGAWERSSVGSGDCSEWQMGAELTQNRDAEHPRMHSHAGAWERSSVGSGIDQL